MSDQPHGTDSNDEPVEPVVEGEESEGEESEDTQPDDH